ncbi:hypothetical protein GCM10025787_33640 [Saccharopolyspora rosea]|uniref:WXG100 family type VII secretion target n=1 Tax=Saccharopolyspora rosea TaxID=524884 RepID=A0ABW3FUX2_9PSEU
MTAPQGPGDFATLNKGDGNQKNWFEQAAGRGSSYWGAVQDVNDAKNDAVGAAQGGFDDSTSPPQWGVAMVSMRAEQLQLLMSPGKTLMSNGLGFLVSIVLSPLVELAEMAIGDPEQMRSTGEGWENVAKWLDQVAEQEKERAQATAATWRGKDGDAFRKQMAEFGEGVTALAQDVRELKDSLDLIADIFDMFVEFVVEVITELVIGLIVQWLAALAASWITAGASVGAASAGTAAQVAGQGARIGGRIAQMQGKLFQLFQKLERLLQRLRESSPLLRRAIHETNQLRNGGMVQKALGRKIDSNPLAKFVTKADESDFTSTGGKMFGRDFKNADWFKDKDADFARRMENAVNDEERSAIAAERSRFHRDVKGVQGLSNGVASHVLSGALGGHMTGTLAAKDVAVGMAKDAAIEQGADAVYGEGKTYLRGDLSEDARRQAEERGFQ